MECLSVQSLKELVAWRLGRWNMLGSTAQCPATYPPSTPPVISSVLSCLGLNVQPEEHHDAGAGEMCEVR